MSPTGEKSRRESSLTLSEDGLDLVGGAASPDNNEGRSQSEAKSGSDSSSPPASEKVGLYCLADKVTSSTCPPFLPFISRQNHCRRASTPAGLMLTNVLFCLYLCYIRSSVEFFLLILHFVGLGLHGVQVLISVSLILTAFGACSLRRVEGATISRSVTPAQKPHRSVKTFCSTDSI